MMRLKKYGVLWQLFCLMICGLLRIIPVYADEVSDPTRPDDVVLPYLPRDASAGQTQPLHLSGVQVNGKHSVAIINNTLLHVGDEYQGYTLATISRSRVLLYSPTKHKVVLALDVADYRTPVNALKTMSGTSTPPATLHKRQLQVKQRVKESASHE